MDFRFAVETLLGILRITDRSTARKHHVFVRGVRDGISDGTWDAHGMVYCTRKVQEGIAR
jgi:hypothetical protein